MTIETTLSTMLWKKLEAVDQLAQIRTLSAQKSVLIFKHSTRCSISRTALDRLERNWKDEEMKDVEPYFLDLISYRDVSNQIASQFDIEHQSPQVLVIKNGSAVHDSSHFDIDYSTIKKVTSSPN